MRDYRLYLHDIIEADNKINEYTDGYDRAGFVSDKKTFDAVVRNLEVIGEAARNIPDEIKLN